MVVMYDPIEDCASSTDELGDWKAILASGSSARQGSSSFFG